MRGQRGRSDYFGRQTAGNQSRVVGRWWRNVSEFRIDENDERRVFDRLVEMTDEPSRGGRERRSRMAIRVERRFIRQEAVLG